MASQVLGGGVGLLTVLSFNREQEQEANQSALTALQRLYGHVGGAGAVFATFEEIANEGFSPEFFQSHPYNKNRIEAIEQQARENGWSITGNLIPMLQVPKADAH